MEYRSKERGFTFYTLLFTLTIIFICIPLQAAILKTIRENSYYEEISIQQFFHFIQQDVMEASDYQIDNNIVLLLLPSGDTVSFEQYGWHVRRQVNHDGHEIYLRDIRSYQVNPLPYGFTVTIISKGGKTYEKDIQYFP